MDMKWQDSQMNIKYLADDTMHSTILFRDKFVPISYSKVVYDI